MKLESCVLGMETQRLNRETMGVLRDLSKYGAMSEAELAACGDVVEDMSEVAEQHDHLVHLVQSASFGDVEEEVDVDAFFADLDTPRGGGGNSLPSEGDVVELPSVPNTVVATVIERKPLPTTSAALL